MNFKRVNINHIGKSLSGGSDSPGSLTSSPDISFKQDNSQQSLSKSVKVTPNQLTSSIISDPESIKKSPNISQSLILPSPVQNSKPEGSTHKLNIPGNPLSPMGNPNIYKSGKSTPEKAISIQSVQSQVYQNTQEKVTLNQIETRKFSTQLVYDNLIQMDSIEQLEVSRNRFENLKLQKNLKLLRKPHQAAESSLIPEGAANINWDQIAGRVQAISPQRPAECMRNVAKNRIAEIVSSQKQFEDSLFPPNQRSLVSNPPKKQNQLLLGNAKEREVLKDIKKWERIKTLYGKSSLTLDKYIDPNDLEAPVNREFTNLASVLCALAHNPALIHNIFQDQQINEVGAYYVKINVDGVWRYILVDDFIPIRHDSQPAFNTNAFVGTQIEVWGVLIEKALASVYGCYENIQNQNYPLYHILRDLTGAPTIQFIFSNFRENIEEMAEIIRQMRSQKYILILSGDQSENSRQRDEIVNLGLHPDYSYTILEISENQLLLHNPWGIAQRGDDFGGFGAQGSSNRVEDQRGFFQLPLVVALNIFSKLSVAQISEKNFYVSVPILHTFGAYSAVKFDYKGKSPAQCIFQINQLDFRHFQNASHNEEQQSRISKTQNKRNFQTKTDNGTSNDTMQQNLVQKQKYQLAIGRIIISKAMNETGLVPISASYGGERNLSLEVELDEGHYTLFILMDWFEQPFEVVLSYYGQEKIENVKKVPYQNNPDLFQNIFDKICVERRVAHQLIKQFVVESVFPDSEIQIVFFNYFNNSEDDDIDIEWDLTALQVDIVQIVGICSPKQRISPPDIWDFRVPALCSQTIAVKVLNHDIQFDQNIAQFLGIKLNDS